MPTEHADLDAAVAVRAPDGSTWKVWNSGHVGWSPTELAAVVQDPDTRQWHADPARENRVLPRLEFEATYTAIGREPRRDPRITRLANLVAELLDEFEAATGSPAACAGQLEQAVADVEAIPEETARRATAHAAQQRRTGFHLGQAARRRPS
ncbi:hypothetical protein L3Q65_01155 (plasmid) [Amycolatopsis sp. FU40]|uniref:hypothetical protein n=1 Tax=Amycolatopsis sp. FU40 TaxID=2914159 RepID=UPI001F1C7443|nr:hypothetical protein [Amycolatopsis sp. FU40]UKD50933.1 hypothetical protein L3Q65_01155 [Amycolatopsis sp. FU40]